MTDAMKICPKCRSVAPYNSYFGAYLCDKCDWRENTTDKIDLISRQAAIDEAKRLMRPDDDGTSINDTVHNMIRILQALPSTQRRTNRDLIEREAVCIHTHVTIGLIMRMDIAHIQSQMIFVVMQKGVRCQNDKDKRCSERRVDDEI